jgi:hypothetical protein
MYFHTSGGDSIIRVICPWAIPFQVAALLVTEIETAIYPDHGHRDAE